MADDNGGNGKGEMLAETLRATNETVTRFTSVMEESVRIRQSQSEDRDSRKSK